MCSLGLGLGVQLDPIHEVRGQKHRFDHVADGLFPVATGVAVLAVDRHLAGKLIVGHRAAPRAHAEGPQDVLGAGGLTLFAQLWVGAAEEHEVGARACGTGHADGPLQRNPIDDQVAIQALHGVFEVVGEVQGDGAQARFEASGSWLCTSKVASWTPSMSKATMG